MSYPRWLAGLATVLAIFGCGYFYGQQQAARDADRARQQASRQQLLRQQQADAKLAALQQQLLRSNQHYMQQLQDMEQNLARYRHLYRRRIELPGQWRLQHDSAAVPAAAPASASVAAAPGATDDLAALDTVSHNYTLCQRWRDTVVAWQEWYRLVSGTP